MMVGYPSNLYHSFGMLFTLPKRTIPSSVPDDLDLFVIGDVHGRSEALRECLQSIADVSHSGRNQRMIVFLGDLIDRGPDSIGACNVALSAVEIADFVHFLPGNHELMLIDVLDGKPPETWLINGGATVMKEIADISPTQRGTCAQALEAHFPNDYLDKIRMAPSHFVIGDLLLVHAGLHPHKVPRDHLDRNRPLLGDENHWASIRYPFLDWRLGWDFDGSRYSWGNKVVVHGHTPAVREDICDNPVALNVCDGIDEYRAVCLDAGASSRNQMGFARFHREGGQTFMQIQAVAL